MRFIRHTFWLRKCYRLEEVCSSNFVNSEIIFSSVVRAGRCPSGGTPGSQRSCNGDTNCPNGEKCCNSKCATIATIGKGSITIALSVLNCSS